MHGLSLDRFSVNVATARLVDNSNSPKGLKLAGLESLSQSSSQPYRRLIQQRDDGEQQ